MYITVEHVTANENRHEEISFEEEIGFFEYCYRMFKYRRFTVPNTRVETWVCITGQWINKETGEAATIDEIEELVSIRNYLKSGSR